MVYVGTHRVLDELGKEQLPAELVPQRPHTHHALDDAVEQAELFQNLRRWRMPTRDELPDLETSNRPGGHYLPRIRVDKTPHGSVARHLNTPARVVCGPARSGSVEERVRRRATVTAGSEEEPWASPAGSS